MWVLCGEERQVVEDQLEGWRKSLEDYGLKVSRKKTEHLKMQAGRGDEGEIELRGVKLKKGERIQVHGVHTEGRWRNIKGSREEDSSGMACVEKYVRNPMR